MRIEVEPTRVVRVYLSGPIDAAKQLMRQECMREGLCVTIEPTTFIYTGGEEAGYVVGMLNYPRFPSTADALYTRARAIALMLMEGTFQHSALVVADGETTWLSCRPSTAAPSTHAAVPDVQNGDAK